MEKSVTYSVVARKDFKNPLGPKKFYAQAQARGVMGIREMADRIQKMCTVTRSDTMAVLVALADVMCDGLAHGEIVRLGELGSFQIGLNGSGAESAEKYTTSLIRRPHINFRPGIDLEHVLSNLSYQRVPTRKEVEAAKPEKGEEDELSVQTAEEEAHHEG